MFTGGQKGTKFFGTSRWVSLPCVNCHIIFPEVIVDEENKFKFKDASFPESSRDLILHKGDLDLSCYSWQFGRTPSYSDKHLSPEWDLEDTEEEAAAEDTAKRLDIGGHPNNTEYKIPCGQVSDSFLLSLRPRTKMP